MQLPANIIRRPELAQNSLKQHTLKKDQTDVNGKAFFDRVEPQLLKPSFSNTIDEQPSLRGPKTPQVLGNRLNALRITETKKRAPIQSRINPTINPTNSDSTIELSLNPKRDSNNESKNVSFADQNGGALDQVKYTNEFQTKHTYELKASYGSRAYRLNPNNKALPLEKQKKNAHKAPAKPPRWDGRGHREAAAISYKQFHSLSSSGPMRVSQQLREIREKLPLQQEEYRTQGVIASNFGYGNHDPVDKNTPTGFKSYLNRLFSRNTFSRNTNVSKIK